MYQLSSPMLDGASAGINISQIDTQDMGVQVTEQEFNQLRCLLVDCPSAYVSEDKVSVSVNVGGTNAVVGVNRNTRIRDKTKQCYYNLSGNPISFFTGQNVFGSIDLPVLIVQFYKDTSRALRLLNPAFELPETIKAKILDLDVRINHLAFAMYSQPLELKNWANFSKFIDLVKHIYNYSNPWTTPSNVHKWLGLTVISEGDMSLLLTKKSGDNRYWSLALYNKWQEMHDSGVANPPEQLKSMVRFDLTFGSKWFHDNEVPTIKQFHKRYGQNYTAGVLHLLNSTFDHTKLLYILSMPNPHNVDVGEYREDFEVWETGGNPSTAAVAYFRGQGLDVSVPYDFHLLVLWARATYQMPKEEAAGLLKSGGSTQELVARLRDSVPMLQAQRMISRLKPHPTFPSFRLTDAGQYINTETGEVLT